MGAEWPPLKGPRAVSPLVQMAEVTRLQADQPPSNEPAEVPRALGMLN
jgi:hypothetical protein